MEGAAAARREDRKLARYEKDKHPGGLSVRSSGSTNLETFWKMGARRQRPI